MTDTLASVRNLLPEVAKRAEQTEEGRGLPAELVGALTEAGCLRMMAPTRHGGAGARVPELLRVLTELAVADGSTAWVVGQVALSQLIISCTPPVSVDEVFAAGPDVFAAGAVAPKGRATAVDGGWRITGQWPYVTGCELASWFYLNCVVVSDRAVRLTDDGTPVTRIVLVPASEVRIADTWRVMGLRGTGSHDVHVNGAICPRERGFGLNDGGADGLAVSRIAQSSLIIAAVAVGIARGALAEIGQLAVGGKRPALSTRRLAQSAVFQDRLGQAHIQARAAEALLAEEAEATAAKLDSGVGLDALDRATTRAVAAQVVGMAATVVDTAHSLGGGTTVYDSSPLQRRLRDIRTATQHFIAGRDSYAALGALLVGEESGTGPL